MIEVSILVLLEVPLRLCGFDLRVIGVLGFNPCFVGSSS